MKPILSPKNIKLDQPSSSSLKPSLVSPPKNQSSPKILTQKAVSKPAAKQPAAKAPPAPAPKKQKPKEAEKEIKVLTQPTNLQAINININERGPLNSDSSKKLEKLMKEGTTGTIMEESHIEEYMESSVHEKEENNSLPDEQGENNMNATKSNFLNNTQTSVIKAIISPANPAMTSSRYDNY